MNMRVLSGILVTRGHRSGSVRINFIDHSVTGTLDRAHKKSTLGRNVRFHQVPAKMVAVREFTFRVNDASRTFPPFYEFRINDGRITKDYLDISWECLSAPLENVPEIEEISYMIIGILPA